MRFWLLLLMLMLHHAAAYPADTIMDRDAEMENEETKKVIGSSVVTSVSVILNGNEPQFTDAVGKPLPKPMVPLQVASPINLLNPDRYEFYTFDDNGELVKRLMTLKEIQSIVANGDGEGGAVVHNIPINDRDPEKNVQDIVQSVQNVLTREVEWNRNASGDQPVLDTPDVSSSWSMILPAIFGNTGDEIFPTKSHQVVMTPETVVMESSSKTTEAPVTTLKPKPTTKKQPKPKPSRKRTTVAPTTKATPAMTSTTAPSVMEMVDEITEKLVEPTAAPQQESVKPIFNRIDVTSPKTEPKQNVSDSAIYTISSLKGPTSAKPPTTAHPTKKPSIHTTITTTEKTTVPTVPIKLITTAAPTAKTTQVTTSAPTVKLTTPSTTTTTTAKATTTTTTAQPSTTKAATTTTTKTTPAPETTTMSAADEESSTTEESSTYYRNEDETTFDSMEDSATQSINEILTSLSGHQNDLNTKLSFNQILESLKTEEHTEKKPEVEEKQEQTTTKAVMSEPMATTENHKDLSAGKSSLTETLKPLSTVAVEPHFVELKDPILKDLPTTTEFLSTDLTTPMSDQESTEKAPEQAALTMAEPTTEVKEEANTERVSLLKTKPAAENMTPIAMIKPPSKIAETIDKFIEENAGKTELGQVKNKETVKMPEIGGDLKMSDFKGQAATIASILEDHTLKSEEMGELKNDMEPVLDIESLMSDIMNQMAGEQSTNMPEDMEEEEEDESEETSHRHSNIAQINADVLGGALKAGELILEKTPTTTERLEATTIEADESMESAESDESKEDISVETSVVKETSSVSMEVKNKEEEKDNYIQITITPPTKTATMDTATLSEVKEMEKETIPVTTVEPSTIQSESTEREVELKTTTTQDKIEELTTPPTVEKTDSSNEDNNLVLVQTVTNSPTTVTNLEELTEKTTELPDEEETTAYSEEITTRAIDSKETDDGMVRIDVTTNIPTTTYEETTAEKEATTEFADVTTTVPPIFSYPETMERHRLPTNYSNNSEKRVTSPVDSELNLQEPEQPFVKLGEPTVSSIEALLSTPKPISQMNDVKITQYNNQRPMIRPAALSNLKISQLSHATRPPVKLDPTPEQSLGLEVSTMNLDEDVQEFAKLCNELAFSYWRSITSDKISPARSIVLSPFALTSMLSMVFLGARGSTSGEMNEILRLDDMVTFNPHLVFENITESVEHARGGEIDSSAFVREIFTDRNNGKVLQFFKEKTQQLYGGHVEEVNFNVVNDIVRRRTNMLVKRHTMGKIIEYLRTNSVWVNGPLATVSANLYQTDCNRGATNDRDGEMFFQVHPSVRQRRLVPIPAVVFRTGFSAGYDPELDATLVAFGAAYDTTSTIYVMPGQQGMAAPGDTLERLEVSLMNGGVAQNSWSRILTTLMERPGLEVQLPRFSHRSFINASMGLQRMGLRALFNSDNADLRGLTGSSHKDVYLADMIQINTFSTCAENKISEHHHVEMYPAPPLRRRNAEYDEETTEPIQDEYGMQEYGRAFYDDLLDPKYLELPLPLRPRQARIPDAPRLRFDKPFLFFVRHNPTGMILFMGRFNPRLLP